MGVVRLFTAAHLPYCVPLETLWPPVSMLPESHHESDC